MVNPYLFSRIKDFVPDPHNEFSRRELFVLGQLVATEEERIPWKRAFVKKLFKACKLQFGEEVSPALAEAIALAALGKSHLFEGELQAKITSPETLIVLAEPVETLGLSRRVLSGLSLRRVKTIAELVRRTGRSLNLPAKVVNEIIFVLGERELWLGMKADVIAEKLTALEIYLRRRAHNQIARNLLVEELLKERDEIDAALERLGYKGKT